MSVGSTPSTGLHRNWVSLKRYHEHYKTSLRPAMVYTFAMLWHPVSSLTVLIVPKLNREVARNLYLVMCPVVPLIWACSQSPTRLHTHTHTHTCTHHTGVFRDCMLTFKRIRDARISDTVVETNRLVIRMEKVSCCRGRPMSSK